MAFLLAVGGFHEFICAIVSVILCIYLIVTVRKTKKLIWVDNLLGWSVAVLVFFYGFGTLWAVDRGMAWIGFWKFLPLFLYLLCLWQKGQGNLLSVLPMFGAATVIVSVIGMFVPVLDGFFAVAERLAGFFQYPNTYALFLLVCELLLLKAGPKKWDYLTLAILLAGLLYTGSRTVFVLALAVNLVWFMAGEKKRLWILAIACAVLALGAGGLLLWGKGTVLYRYLTISIKESTFVGRILYTLDALPLLLKYPFGMGYMGYYHVQTSIQTGVYSVAFAHNDILQLFLDVGLVPAALFVAAVVAYFCRKDISFQEKLIPGTVLAHCLFDFDLQFVAVFVLLLVLMEPTKGSVSELKKADKALQGVFGVVCAVGVYMSLALGLAYFEARQISNVLYPFNTQNKLQMLEQEPELGRANALADQILKQNAHCYPAYSIKSKYAYSQGDFAAVIQYKKLVLRENPFDHRELEEYCRMLMAGIPLYTQAGDDQSAQICRQELLAVKAHWEGNAQRLSFLGKRIDTQPVLKIPQDIAAYIEKIEE